MNIAIFGGSFNPVHNEHINIVKAAISSLSLDRVIVMPTYLTPLKNGRMFASSADRLNMCRAAFAEIPQVTVSDYEISRGGVSYSYITCREFAKKYPSYNRYFIVGGDMFENFYNWKYPEEILKCVRLAVCAREDKSKIENEKIKFYSVFGNRAEIFDYVGKSISSTRIRVLAALGESLDGYVKSEVGEYIAVNSLYKINGADEIKRSLSSYRWKHTVGVAVMAAENCARYNVAEKDAIIAALFHDCGKELPVGDGLLSGFKAPIDVPPPVVHQFTGAYLAEHVYGVKNGEIINAVKYHCSGRENMSPLEKLIYLSDLLEEGRDYDGVGQLRALFKRDKDEAFVVAMERQLSRLKVSGFPVYDLTQKAYDYAKEHKNDE